MIQILFAFLAGILTIAAPCILPTLPILLGASVGQKSKQRPLLIVAGFVVSFAAVSLILSLIIENLGLSPTIIRNSAITLLFLFALFMIWPLPFELLSKRLSGIITKANQLGDKSGNMGGLVLGLVLGIIWTPCAGPILGSILTLIASQGVNAHSSVLFIAYALGAGIPMLIIAYGSQWITTKVRSIAQYSRRLQQGFGLVVLLLAIAMFFQYDTKIQAVLVEHFPAFNVENNFVSKRGNPIMPGLQNTPIIYNAVSGEMATGKKNMQKIALKNYGPAPEFTGISTWLNSKPLSLADLKGKVVLVDFWTYSCINCIRTMPYLTKWFDTYKDQGLVIIGVHTPEFPFEKETGNVQTAMKRFGINYPVAQDNDYGTWNAYRNQYWPAEYLIDKDGTIVYTHFGEGNYDHTENVIRQLLGLDREVTASTSLTGKVRSPEMYFGTDRLEYISASQQAATSAKDYSLPESLKLNEFALEGNWQFSSDKTSLLKGSGKIKLHFSSGKVHMVAANSNPAKTITLKIVVDGKNQPDVNVNLSQLYTLFDSSDYTNHIIEIQIPEAGFEAFTFTFG